mmetsp:Transcript_18726/g.52918  ORF Transcript_18726/g.52918 Transcript_18726/m.52918 type:complete len:205 (+) Transcript_18726:83-697(+)
MLQHIQWIPSGCVRMEPSHHVHDVLAVPLKQKQSHPRDRQTSAAAKHLSQPCEPSNQPTDLTQVHRGVLQVDPPVAKFGVHASRPARWRAGANPRNRRRPSARALVKAVRCVHAAVESQQARNSGLHCLLHGQVMQRVCQDLCRRRLCHSAAASGTAGNSACPLGPSAPVFPSDGLVLDSSLAPPGRHMDGVTLHKAELLLATP